MVQLSVIIGLLTILFAVNGCGGPSKTVEMPENPAPPPGHPPAAGGFNPGTTTAED